MSSGSVSALLQQSHQQLGKDPKQGCSALIWLTFGPNTTPPPGFSGELLDPCLALPVPFCAKGFLPPPLTSARVLVFAVPCKVDGLG